MKFSPPLFLVALLVCFLSGLSTVQAAEPLHYDATRQAIAVDPYFDGFGGRIELDFNADHAWAAVIDQSLWHYLYGSTTEVGLYNYTSIQYPGGGSSQSWVYGWGTRLGSLNAINNYLSYVTTLYTGLPALDKYRYFCDTWSVAGASTVIYVQPALALNSGMPVSKADLNNVYFRINRGAWQRFTDVYQTEPDPLLATITVNPGTLNRKSKGNWITSYIELPAGAALTDIDTTTITLKVQQTVLAAGTIDSEVLYTAGPMTIGDDNSNDVPDLMVKFDRSDLIALLQPGAATLIIKGKLFDGTPFEGNAPLRVIH